MLHDIGKAVSHEEEGPYATLGAEIAKKYGESEKNRQRHCGTTNRSRPFVLNQCSWPPLRRCRPPARGQAEALESYVKRLEKLESLAHARKASKGLPSRQEEFG